MTISVKSAMLRTTAAATLVAFGATSVAADEITYVSGATGAAVENFAALVAPLPASFFA